MGETGFCLRTFSTLGEPPAGHICYLSEYSFYTGDTSFISKVFFHSIIKSIVVYQQIKKIPLPPGDSPIAVK
jgi:hypothetical protein